MEGLHLLTALRTAAKHIHGVSRKARVWNVLNDIQTHTGYHTQTTVKHLQTQVERGL
jgi:hypothetical protein